MTIAPRFSPDGQKVVMSLLQDDGSANVYTMDLRNRSTTRLTNSQAIDTSASYSPDGSQIVFSSDRGGRPQLYIMGADGSNPRRISMGDGSYPRRSGRRAETSSPSPSSRKASSLSV